MIALHLELLIWGFLLAQQQQQVQLQSVVMLELLVVLKQLILELLQLQELQVVVEHLDQVVLLVVQEQAEAVAAAYAPWFVMDPPRDRNGWTGLSGRRR